MSCTPRQPTDGSTLCHADAATRTSKRRPPSSQSSNVEISTSTLAKVLRPLASERGHSGAGLDCGH
jgi:hypothetical protein